jgi:hypothetical protein
MLQTVVTGGVCFLFAKRVNSPAEVSGSSANCEGSLRLVYPRWADRSPIRFVPDLFEMRASARIPKSLEAVRRALVRAPVSGSIAAR